MHAFIHRLSTPHHCPRPLSAARAHRVFPRQTTRFNLLILMTYEVKPNDQGSPSYGWPHLPLKGLSITFESHSAGKSNNFPRQRDDRVYPVSSLSCIYNLRYCSFRGDKEGVEWREGRRERDTSSEGIERQHDLIVARYGSRFHYLPLLYLQRLAPVTLARAYRTRFLVRGMVCYDNVV